VTGGTKGVGRATVQTLAASGAHVVFQGRDRDAAREVVQSIAPGLPQPTFVPGDLYDADNLAHLVSVAVDRHGRIDGAVGSGMSGTSGGIRPFREIAAADIIRYFESGALGRMLLLHAVAGPMAAHGYGKVVFVTTDAGRVPTPGESLIGAAAASVIYFTRAVARELAGDGIRVNSLAITITKDTPGYDGFAAKRDAGERDVHVKAFEKIEARAPFGLGTAAQAADVATFLLAPGSDGMTGATLSLNQGAYFPTYA
jgi:3-oxoacyl-[acyl-carrier protein] reductase